MIEKKVFELFLLKDSILVFHNENIRREYLAKFALKKETAILQEKGISWDNFMYLFLPEINSKKLMNPLKRKLFINQFIEKNDLEYFIDKKIREKYEESLDRFSSYISTILPLFKNALEEKEKFMNNNAVPNTLKNDVSVLQHSYSKFLSEHELIEPAYLSPSVTCLPKEMKDKQFYIIGGDTIPESKRFLKKLGFPSFIHNITIESCNLDFDNFNKLEHFENSVQEIRTTLRRIRYLLDNGINPSNIAISLVSYDDYIEEITNEAEHYDILIKAQRGKSPLSSFAGRFLNGMQTLYDENFSIDSLKAFLLDPVIPFKEREIAQSLVMTAIENNIEKGNSTGTKNDGYIQKIKDKELKKYYMTLKLNISEICGASTINKMEKALFSFQELLLKKGGFSNTSSEKVYGFCMTKKDELKEDLDAMQIYSYPKVFSLWMQLLSKSIYVPQTNITGIPVYSYPHYSSLSVDYHFLIGLNHDMSLIVDRPLSFLPGSISESNERGETDLTKNVIMDYLSSGNCIPSYSADDRTGSRLPPSFFTEYNLLLKGKRNLKEIEDSFKAELNHFSDVPKSIFQFKAYENALKTVLSEKKGDNIADQVLKKIPGINKIYKNNLLFLSSTKIDFYSKCPFRFFMKYVLGIDKEDYSIVSLDRMSLGNFLHKVYQDFYQSLDRGIVCEQSMDILKDRMRNIFDQRLEEYRQKEGISYSTFFYIKNKYREKIVSILDEEIKKFGLTKIDYDGLEKHLEYHGTNFILDGRIDRISQYIDNEEGYILIDYKTGGTTPISSISGFKKELINNSLSSCQFPVYRFLLKEKEGKECLSAAYYSIEKSSFVFVWNSKSERSSDVLDCSEIDLVLENIIKNTVNKLSNHEFMATPDEKNCINCDYRQVCRKRYTKG